MIYKGVSLWRNLMVWIGGEGKNNICFVNRVYKLINRGREIEVETNFWIFMVHVPKEENVCCDNVF